MINKVSLINEIIFLKGKNTITMINKVSLINEIETLFPLFNNIRSETQQQVHSDKKETDKKISCENEKSSFYLQVSTNKLCTCCIPYGISFGIHGNGFYPYKALANVQYYRT